MVAKKVQVVLDDHTFRLLEELAQPRAGNKSFVVREALRYFAERESNLRRALNAALSSRGGREAMNAGVAAWKKGDLVPHESVIREERGRKRPR